MGYNVNRNVSAKMLTGESPGVELEESKNKFRNKSRVELDV